MKPLYIRTLAALSVAAVLAGCATAPPEQAEAIAPAQWRAPQVAGVAVLPHGGQVQQLLGWWQRWNDPLLVDLIDAAQQASPNVIGHIEPVRM